MLDFETLTLCPIDRALIEPALLSAEEIAWITSHQAGFDRQEEAFALKLGRLLDAGTIQIGCRLLGKA